jgi:crotonobetainyl-CoA:carnitine CoA-transferase CaiB-like acyl-CoA transferase
VSGILSGLRFVEIAGLGPAPFCAMLLADLGADVILIERRDDRPLERRRAGEVFNRGKRSIRIDLKQTAGTDLALRMIDTADGVIEAMRPGTMERLGLGPEVCLARNPRLAYGRMTGWGQHGPLSQAAGHDINYLALSGALWFAGAPDRMPAAPPTMLGDLGGGALYLALGLLAAILQARETGRGQVIDAAVVDGCAHLSALQCALLSSGQLSLQRGISALDGSPWYRPYRCLDGRLITVGPLEPKFFALLIEALGLQREVDPRTRSDPATWPSLEARLTALFATRTADQWRSLLEGTDACFAPLLSVQQAAEHPHMRARGAFERVDGVLQPQSAPRFSAYPPTPIRPVPAVGEHTTALLQELGLDEEQMRGLREAGVV